MEGGCYFDDGLRVGLSWNFAQNIFGVGRISSLAATHPFPFCTPVSLPFRSLFPPSPSFSIPHTSRSFASSSSLLSWFPCFPTHFRIPLSSALYLIHPASGRPLCYCVGLELERGGCLSSVQSCASGDLTWVPRNRAGNAHASQILRKRPLAPCSLIVRILELCRVV